MSTYFSGLPERGYALLAALPQGEVFVSQPVYAGRAKVYTFALDTNGLVQVVRVSLYPRTGEAAIWSTGRVMGYALDALAPAIAAFLNAERAQVWCVPRAFRALLVKAGARVYRSPFEEIADRVFAGAALVSFRYGTWEFVPVVDGSRVIFRAAGDDAAPVVVVSGAQGATQSLGLSGLDQETVGASSFEGMASAVQHFAASLIALPGDQRFERAL